jgi:putative SOS response-associated peptidase YedK
MCGRFAFHSPHDTVVQLFQLPADTAPVEPRWNIAPTQPVAAVRAARGGGRELAMLHWGLVPAWARERSIGQRLINARAETLADKASFRSAFRHRRCLVLADGYYEWRAVAAGKQPYFVHAASREPFGMAGLWETWRDPESGEPLESCVIITRPAAGRVLEIHARMPLIIPPRGHGAWLDAATSTDDARIVGLIADDAAVALAAYPVSRRVNNPRNEGPGLATPATADAAYPD